MQAIQSLDVIADRVVFVNVDITCWSGKKCLTPEDLGLRADQLPPETLVSLGDKQLIDPRELREFTSLRSAARRYCLAVGTRFLGGWLVPGARAQALLERLGELEQQFSARRADFLIRFDSLVQDWTRRQPAEWRRLIREALVPGDYVGRRLSFSVQAVRLATPEAAVVDHPGLDRAIGGLSSQLFAEVAVMAHETLEKSFQGRTEVTRRVLSPVRSIRDKLDGLSFIDSRIRVVVDAIDRLLAGIPAKRPITGSVLQGLCDFLDTAAQPERLRAFAERRGPAGTPGDERVTAFEATPASPVDEPRGLTHDTAWAASKEDAVRSMVSDPDADDEADARVAPTQDATGVEVPEHDEVASPELEPHAEPVTTADDDWFF